MVIQAKFVLLKPLGHLCTDRERMTPPQEGELQLKVLWETFILTELEFPWIHTTGVLQLFVSHVYMLQKETGKFCCKLYTGMPRND